MATMTDGRYGAEYEFRRELLAVPASVGLGRDLAKIQLRKWGLSFLVEDAALVVSELLTNAVTASPRRVLGLEVYLLPHALMIEVSDPCEMPPRPRTAMPTDTGGRGLRLVEHYALRWGTRWPPAGGKVVWAQMAIT